MLRITVARKGAGVVLRVEGRLVASEAGLLEQEVRRIQAEGLPLALDVDGVSHIDAAGTRQLRELRLAGVQVEGGSLYLRTVLERDGML